MATGYVQGGDHLLTVLTARQFSEWAAYYSQEPFGDMRADLRMGILAATINNRWRGKNERPAEPKDFMPFFREPVQTADEIKSTLRSVLAQVNG